MTRLAARRARFASRYLLLIFLLASAGAVAIARQSKASANDWPVFGGDLASTNVSPSSAITAANIGSLVRHQVTLDGIADASAIYLHGVTVHGAPHDVFFVTTEYGKTVAIDAAQASILWEYAPPNYSSWAGTRQFTNTTPVADPDRESIYTGEPDGTMVKLSIADGKLLWSTPITLLPSREKIDSTAKVFRGHVIAVTAGYVGDAPYYQGHVAILDAQTGKLLHVWNSLCSDRTGLIDPSTCNGQLSGIWGRPGAVIDAATGNIFVATGNGTYDGKTNWGDAVIELNPDATAMLGNYTPEDNAEIDKKDLDIGSTSPVLLGDGILAQGGKDAILRLISIKSMAGTSPHAGGELQTVPTPAGGRMLSSPVVWHDGAQTWLFAASAPQGPTPAGTQAWTFTGGKLVDAWQNSNPGTSPTLAGGLLYVYDPGGAGIRVYDAVKGTPITTLECGRGHWNSPIVVDGRIALPEGNANMRAATGVFDIWSLPAPH